MTFGLSWWLRPEERADIGTPLLVMVQAWIAAVTLDLARADGGTFGWLSVVTGGFFVLLTLRNSLRLLRSRPVATTAMLVSLGLSALLTALLAAGPILETDAPLRGLLLLPALVVLVAGLAQEAGRRLNLKQA